MKSMIFLACLLPLCVSAQRTKTSIDKLTGDTIVTSSHQLLNCRGLNSLNVYLKKEKGQNTLHLSTTLRFEYLPKIRKDAPLYLKLLNGAIITLHATDTFDSEPVDIADIYQGCRIYPRYGLDDHAIELLKLYPVVLIRLHYNAEFIDFEIEQSDQSIISKTVLLMFK